jgi:hypothetical protein
MSGCLLPPCADGLHSAGTPNMSATDPNPSAHCIALTNNTFPRPPTTPVPPAHPDLSEVQCRVCTAKNARNILHTAWPVSAQQQPAAPHSALPPLLTGQLMQQGKSSAVLQLFPSHRLLAAVLQARRRSPCDARHALMPAHSLSSHSIQPSSPLAGAAPPRGCCCLMQLPRCLADASAASVQRSPWFKLYSSVVNTTPGDEFGVTDQETQPVRCSPCARACAQPQQQQHPNHLPSCWCRPTWGLQQPHEAAPLLLRCGRKQQQPCGNGD